MEKLKRQIGYKPYVPKCPSPVTGKSQVELEISAILEIQKSRSKKIADWIKDHPDFKWTPMCNDLKIDKGYFSRAINSASPLFKIEDIPDIENRIKKYGYLQ